MDTSLLDDSDDENDYAVELEDEFFNTYLENLDCAVDPQAANVFLDCNEILKITTSTIRLNGVNKCGQENVSIPDHTNILAQCTERNVILSQNNLLDDDMNNVNENGDAGEKVIVKDVSRITSADLYEVHNTSREVITEFDDLGRQIQKIVPNGTLENIQEYAAIAFGTDTDQQIAFTQLVAAFVVKLHEKASFNEFFL